MPPTLFVTISSDKINNNLSSHLRTSLGYIARQWHTLRCEYCMG